MARNDGPQDHDLLERFLGALKAESEDAFRILVVRHGSRVLKNCRRVLVRAEGAEDAFQRKFLVLARSGAWIRDRNDLTGWLNGVAYRIARRMRARATRRRAVEKQSAAMSPPGSSRPIRLGSGAGGAAAHTPWGGGPAARGVPPTGGPRLPRGQDQRGGRRAPAVASRDSEESVGAGAVSAPGTVGGAWRLAPRPSTRVYGRDQERGPIDVDRAVRRPTSPPRARSNLGVPNPAPSRFEMADRRSGMCPAVRPGGSGRVDRIPSSC